MLVQRTVYFREEDIEKWNQVKNKAEFIHNALNPGKMFTVPAKMSGTGKDEPAYIKKPVKTPDDLAKEALPPREQVKLARNPKLCKHGNPKGECFHKEAGRLGCNK